MDAAPNESAKLVEELRQRRLTVFAGAGISMLPPSCLPSWWAVNHAILDALAAEATVAMPSAPELVARVKQREEDGKLPPEFAAEVIVGSFGSDYFEVLSCLEGTRANRIHRWLAALGKAGRLPAILTTNFDTLVERAFEEVGAPLRVLVDAADYASVDFERHRADPSAPTLLLKLHGTAARPDTCVDTLQQRKKGFPTPVRALAREVVRHTRLCMMGFSGADLEAEPNYLSLRQMASEGAPGFTWLYLPNTQPPPAVRALAERYGESRARFAFGWLPGWMDDWAAALEGTAVPPPEAASFADDAVKAIKAEAAAALKRSCAEWARRRSPVGCGVVLGDLAHAAAFPVEERRAREEVHAYAEATAPRSRQHGISRLKRAQCLHRAGEVEVARAELADTVRLFNELGARDGLADALASYAGVLETLGRLPDAQEVYRAALDLSDEVGDDEDAVLAELHLSMVVAKRGAMPQAENLARDAAARAERLGDEALREQVVAWLANVLQLTGRLDEALAHLRDAEAVARRLGRDTSLGSNLVAQAEVHLVRAELPRADGLLGEAEQLAERLGHRALRAAVLMTRATRFTKSGDGRRAVECLGESAELRGAIGDRVGRVECLGNRVGLRALLGEAQAAVEEGRAAIAEAEALGIPRWVAILCSNTALACEYAGNFESAQALYERALPAQRELADRVSEARTLGNLGNLAYRQGRLESAEARYRECLAVSEALGDVEARLRTGVNLANLLVQGGKLPEAVTAYREALALAEANGMAGLCGPLHLNLAMARWRLADFLGAAESYGPAQALLAAGGDNANAGLAAYYHACARANLGEPARAVPLLEEALALWHGLEHPSAPQARALLESLRPKPAG